MANEASKGSIGQPSDALDTEIIDLEDEDEGEESEPEENNLQDSYEDEIVNYSENGIISNDNEDDGLSQASSRSAEDENLMKPDIDTEARESQVNGEGHETLSKQQKEVENEEENKENFVEDQNCRNFLRSDLKSCVDGDGDSPGLKTEIENADNPDISGKIPLMDKFQQKEVENDVDNEQNNRESSNRDTNASNTSETNPKSFISDDEDSLSPKILIKPKIILINDETDIVYSEIQTQSHDKFQDKGVGRDGDDEEENLEGLTADENVSNSVRLGPKCLRDDNVDSSEPMFEDNTQANDEDIEIIPVEHTQLMEECQQRNIENGMGHEGHLIKTQNEAETMDISIGDEAGNTVPGEQLQSADELHHENVKTGLDHKDNNIEGSSEEKKVSTPSEFLVSAEKDSLESKIDPEPTKIPIDEGVGNPIPEERTPLRDELEEEEVVHDSELEEDNLISLSDLLKPDPKNSIVVNGKNSICEDTDTDGLNLTKQMSGVALIEGEAIQNYSVRVENTHTPLKENEKTLKTLELELNSSIIDNKDSIDPDMQQANSELQIYSEIEGLVSEEKKSSRDELEQKVDSETEHEEENLKSMHEDSKTLNIPETDPLFSVVNKKDSPTSKTGVSLLQVNSDVINPISEEQMSSVNEHIQEETTSKSLGLDENVSGSSGQTSAAEIPQQEIKNDSNEERMEIEEQISPNEQILQQSKIPGPLDDVENTLGDSNKNKDPLSIAPAVPTCGPSNTPLQQTVSIKSIRVPRKKRKQPASGDNKKQRQRIRWPRSCRAKRTRKMRKIERRQNPEKKYNKFKKPRPPRNLGDKKSAIEATSSGQTSSAEVPQQTVQSNLNKEEKMEVEVTYDAENPPSEVQLSRRRTIREANKEKKLQRRKKLERASANPIPPSPPAPTTKRELLALLQTHLDSEKIHEAKTDDQRKARELRMQQLWQLKRNFWKHKAKIAEMDTPAMREARFLKEVMRAAKRRIAKWRLKILRRTKKMKKLQKFRVTCWKQQSLAQDKLWMSCKQFQKLLILSEKKKSELLRLEPKINEKSKNERTDKVVEAVIPEAKAPVEAGKSDFPLKATSEEKLEVLLKKAKIIKSGKMFETRCEVSLSIPEESPALSRVPSASTHEGQSPNSSMIKTKENLPSSLGSEEVLNVSDRSKRELFTVESKINKKSKEERTDDKVVEAVISEAEAPFEADKSDLPLKETSEEKLEVLLKNAEMIKNGKISETHSEFSPSVPEESSAPPVVPSESTQKVESPDSSTVEVNEELSRSMGSTIDIKSKDEEEDDGIQIIGVIGHKPVEGDKPNTLTESSTTPGLRLSKPTGLIPHSSQVIKAGGVFRKKRSRDDERTASSTTDPHAKQIRSSPEQKRMKREKNVKTVDEALPRHGKSRRNVEKSSTAQIPKTSNVKKVITKSELTEEEKKLMHECERKSFEEKRLDFIKDKRRLKSCKVLIEPIPGLSTASKSNIPAISVQIPKTRSIGSVYDENLRPLTENSEGGSFSSGYGTQNCLGDSEREECLEIIEILEEVDEGVMNGAGEAVDLTLSSDNLEECSKSSVVSRKSRKNSATLRVKGREKSSPLEPRKRKRSPSLEEDVVVNKGPCVNPFARLGKRKKPKIIQEFTDVEPSQKSHDTFDELEELSVSFNNKQKKLMDNRRVQNTSEETTPSISTARSPNLARGWYNREEKSKKTCSKNLFTKQTQVPKKEKIVPVEKDDEYDVIVLSD